MRASLRSLCMRFYKIISQLICITIIFIISYIIYIYTTPKLEGLYYTENCMCGVKKVNLISGNIIYISDPHHSNTHGNVIGSYSANKITYPYTAGNTYSYDFRKGLIGLWSEDYKEYVLVRDEPINNIIYFINEKILK